MIFATIIFFLGCLSIFFFLTWKAPLLVGLSDKKDNTKDFVVVAREKIEEGVRREIKENIEEILQRVLSSIRRFLIKVEQGTTKWIFILKRKRRRKDNDKPE